jgi:hypothetical protein
MPGDERAVPSASLVRVGLEVGQTWVFTSAIAWPGWTTKIADHVREAEHAYCSKIGRRVPPRTPWHDQRAAFASALRAGATGGSWTARDAVARNAWHVLDHAWEIEDRTGWQAPGALGRNSGSGPVAGRGAYRRSDPLPSNRVGRAG